VRLMDSGLQPVPHLRLQTDQVAEQPGQIDVHGRTMPPK
jgi:hypothetical protein